MHEMTSELERALSQVGADWNPERVEGSWRGLRRKRTRRRITRTVAATATVAVVLLGVYTWSGRGAAQVADQDVTIPDHRAEDPAKAENLAAEPKKQLVLGDGTVVTPEQDAKVEVVDRADRPRRVRVVRGKSLFDVPAERGDAGQPVEIEAGRARFLVFSSSFSVAHHEGDTEVWVHSGQVKVEWHEQILVLDEGEHQRFAGDRAGEHDAERPAATSRSRRSRRSDEASWRELAREGDFDAAYQALRRGSMGKRPGDLLLAADVYRMSGHPRAAVEPLERVVSRHRNDSRAPLAAFTLGRVLLDELDQPARAARAFHKARTFAPRGPLAEDALAREVEAWAKAGNKDKARARAELYMETYPDGHRVRAVKQYGGL